MSSFIAVHVGAGYHRKEHHSSYAELIREALLQGHRCLRNGSSGVEVVRTCISVLEDCAMTNAGRGSSLTNRGTVECDASVMEGKSLSFGAVGGVPGVPNPISLATKVLTEQQQSLPLGLQPPLLLVGEAAKDWAAQHGVETCDPSALKTANSVSMFQTCCRKLKECETGTTDTKKRSRSFKKRRQSREVDAIKVSFSGTQWTVDALSGYGNKKETMGGFSESNCNGKKHVQNESQYKQRNESINSESRTESNGTENQTLAVNVTNTNGETNFSPKINNNGLVNSSSHVSPNDHNCTNNNLVCNAKRKSALRSSESEESSEEKVCVDAEKSLDDLLMSRLDTVGCVVVNASGDVFSGVSSGGVLLKQPGRVGQAGVFAAGCWSENDCNDSGCNVASSSTGCGEDLIMCQMAVSAARAIADISDPMDGRVDGRLRRLLLENKFIRKRQKVGGCLIVRHDPSDGSTDLYCFHSARTMGYGYMGADSRKPSIHFSSQSKEKLGVDMVVEFASYCNKQ